MAFTVVDAPKYCTRWKRPAVGSKRTARPICASLALAFALHAQTTLAQPPVSQDANSSFSSSVKNLRDPASALYGIDGLAGAISFTTRDLVTLIVGDGSVGRFVSVQYSSAGNEPFETVAITETQETTLDIAQANAAKPAPSKHMNTGIAVQATIGAKRIPIRADSPLGSVDHSLVVSGIGRISPPSNAAPSIFANTPVSFSHA